VIFQHGITLNRTVMFSMADSFAQAGFAVVAIDLPLHGITDTANPFYQGPGHPFGNNERHFNMDNVGATGVFGTRRPDRRRLADIERRQSAERARPHPPSRGRHDRAEAHAARARRQRGHEPG
jgi:pimeloyl-ACP methyl ester carboxylesterase